MSIASQPDARSDAIELYLRYPGEGALARAFTTVEAARAGTVLQRATAGVLRGGLTTWVHVGMLVRRMRGRSDPLQGLGREETFDALCRLTQATVEGVVVQAHPDAAGDAHVRMFTTPFPADQALPRLQQVLQPYAAAGTLTRTGRAVIGWFAIRHLIAVRSSAYSLQVVHLTPEGGGPCQMSLMLPRVTEAPQHQEEPLGPRRQRRRDQRAAERAAAVDAVVEEAAAAVRTTDGGPGPAATNPVVAPPIPLQDYLDSYREHLTRELLLEPLETASPVPGFAWTPEPTGGGGLAVAGTVPAAIPDRVVLRMAAQAVAQLGQRAPERAGASLGDPEPDGDLLVQRWTLGAAAACVLSVAARSGEGRRPTQVLIHLGGVHEEADPGPQPAPVALEVPYQIPRTGPAVDEARELLLLPMWWHSADARCDGNDVILYEMPFRGRKLRIRANDYPAEPMYTLLVGDPGAEVAAVDLEDWPASWTRPRAY
ncbi:MAG TPA: hypothetical protein VI248_22085 [Kineosporiaceae bacterium]